ncbi:hypothetical protein [Pelagibius sp.]|uniref:hypothetical protein n=1 Tax=Pelagibius sp. TaxID=1931238 RepID=UPI0026182751|nr:hypothetical protein [Pelagibius sp.]
MHCFRALAMGAALVALGSCSSIVQGTDQSIVVNTNPPEATCKLEREGQQIGAVLATPASVTVSKTKHDITITCEKDGHNPATFVADSGWESGSGAAGIALDVVLTLGISSVIDSATGADNRYQSPINITLVPANVQGSVGVDETRPLSDGEWFGQDGDWQLSLTVQGDQVTGEASGGDTEALAVNGRVLLDNVVDARVKRNKDAAWATLSGFFPRVLLIRNGQIEATFELEEKASGSAEDAAPAS